MGSHTPALNTKHSCHLIHYLRQFWKYTKWPLALLLVCAMVGWMAYFLISENDLNETDELRHMHSKSPSFADEIDFHQPDKTAINLYNHYKHINRTNLYKNKTSNVNNMSNRYVTTNQSQTYRPISETDFDSGSTTQRNFNSPVKISSTSTTTRPKTVPPPPVPSVSPILVTVSSTLSSILPSSTIKPLTTPVSVKTSSMAYKDSIAIQRDRKAPVYAEQEPNAPKYTTLLLNTKDDQNDNIVENSKLLFPTKETFQIFGFTSGHQNSFGIPIEEDERILRILNEEVLINQRKLNKTGDYRIGSTTDSSLFRTKVSPTLPIVHKFDVTTENVRVNSTDDCKYIFFIRFILLTVTKLYKQLYFPLFL